MIRAQQRRHIPPPDTEESARLLPPVPEQPGPVRPSGGYRRPRRMMRLWPVPRWLRWGAVVLVAGLVFRRAVAWLVLSVLSASLHLIGINAHFPHIRFGWPWQSITSGTSSNVQIGPWVLQKIQGISKPALGTENFNFMFTHKVTKNIGFFPCWYSATFYAVGHASATVNLNPGPAWWRKPTGHYKLQVLSRPATGKPGQVAIRIMLPAPQLPQSMHDVTIDNTVSQPVNSQHSWTYPGFGCGVLIRPQFQQSVLYSQAQSVAYQQVVHDPQISQPLVAAAESEAVQMVRNNFVQPTVNAFGYTLSKFTIVWTGAR